VTLPSAPFIVPTQVPARSLGTTDGPVVEFPLPPHPMIVASAVSPTRPHLTIGLLLPMSPL
jgi:hypothetical protein